MPIRILIADDHSVVRQGLRMFLGLDPELQVVGEVQDGAAAVRMARELRPDVVLMDLLMPVMDGIAATEVIRRELPDIEVLALTSVLEDASVVAAVRAGAIGYMLKNTEADGLIRAIKAAAEGQVQLSPEAAARLMREVRAPQSPEALTERETEVLRLVAQGQANKQIPVLSRWMEGRSWPCSCATSPKHSAWPGRPKPWRRSSRACRWPDRWKPR